VLITSATLRDEAESDQDDPETVWREAEARTGASHLPARSSAPPSLPFDYCREHPLPRRHRVAKEYPGQVAAAFRRCSSPRGRRLGLFTAIRRLREVHARSTAHSNRPAYRSTPACGCDGHRHLVDVFRAEEHACLLGTDAMRDGVDVPGYSLRLLVFDRVPWPGRPSCTANAACTLRRPAQGLRRPRRPPPLRQAFGRLIRRADDRGVFVMAGPLLPFPPAARPAFGGR